MRMIKEMWMINPKLKKSNRFHGFDKDEILRSKNKAENILKIITRLSGTKNTKEANRFHGFSNAEIENSRKAKAELRRRYIDACENVMREKSQSAPGPRRPPGHAIGKPLKAWDTSSLVAVTPPSSQPVQPQVTLKNEILRAMNLEHEERTIEEGDIDNIHTDLLTNQEAVCGDGSESSGDSIQISEDADTNYVVEDLKITSNIQESTVTTSKGVRRRNVRCKTCEPCLAEDCGACVNCLDKPKFGGPNKKKSACLKRKCVALSTGKSSLPRVRNTSSKVKTKGTTKRRRPAPPASLSPASPVHWEIKYLVPKKSPENKVKKGKVTKSKKPKESPEKKVKKGRVTRRRKKVPPKIPKFKVTVYDICRFFYVVDYPLLITDQIKERFQDLSSFVNFYAPLLACVNPGKDPMLIKTFCHAKWREEISSEAKEITLEAEEVTSEAKDITSEAEDVTSEAEDVISEAEEVTSEAEMD